MLGVDAALALKLWDIAPDGAKTLVTRGVYRLSEAGGDPAAGTIGTKLYGNMWGFAPGHLVQLQLVQVDGPYLRPDTLPSALAFGTIQLVLPVREALKTTLAAAWRTKDGELPWPSVRVGQGMVVCPGCWRVIERRLCRSPQKRSDRREGEQTGES